MKFLITGAAGFIGSTMSKVLADAGHDVTLVDNMSHGHYDNLSSHPKLLENLLELDVRQNLAQLLKPVDVVLHFAGISSLPLCQENPQESFDANVNGTISVLEYARTVGVQKFIFASTSAVYENSTQRPFREDVIVNPHLTYSLSKKVGEDLCSSYNKSYGMNCIALRFFNVFGEHQDIHRKNPPFISYLLKCIVNNELAYLFNDADIKRDYIYVKDLITKMKLVIENRDEQGGIYNICSEHSYSVPNIVKIIKEHDPRLMVEYCDPTTFWSNFSKLKEGKFTLLSDIVKNEVMKESIGSSSKFDNTFGKVHCAKIEDKVADMISFAKKELSV